jgi:hypothetical protein
MNLKVNSTRCPVFSLTNSGKPIRRDCNVRARHLCHLARALGLIETALEKNTSPILVLFLPGLIKLFARRFPSSEESEDDC